MHLTTSSFYHQLFRMVFTHSQDQIRSDQSLSCVWLLATSWIAARQASLSITNSQSSLRLTSIESVMPSSHLILCCPLLLLPQIPPSIRVFSNESTLRMRWPKYRSFCVTWNLLTVSSFFRAFRNFFYNKPGQALSLTVYIYSVTLKVSP